MTPLFTQRTLKQNKIVLIKGVRFELFHPLKSGYQIWALMEPIIQKEKNLLSITQIWVKKSIYIYKEKLNELMIMPNVEDEIDVEEIDTEVEPQIIPNYEEYIVDHKVEHTPYEDFTHIGNLFKILITISSSLFFHNVLAG